MKKRGHFESLTFAVRSKVTLLTQLARIARETFITSARAVA